MERALDDLQGSSYLRSHSVDRVIIYFDSRYEIAELTADH
jgi:hypothetical protein